MVEVINQIVVPGRPARDSGYSDPPYRQVHLHSTGNPNSSIENEKNYLANNWSGAFYTHLVGFNPATNRAEAWQVAQTNAGGWDLGGDWNVEGYASIEFVEGSVKTQDQFNQAYRVYIELARQLADEAGIPKTIDTADVWGIKTHNYASATGHGSDHVDPIQFLANWGVSRDQLNNDIINGLGGYTPPINPSTQGDEDMLLFKSDIDTAFGNKDNVYLQTGNVVVKLDSGDSLRELRENGVPFTTVTKRNAEGIIKANGGLK